MRFLSNIIDKFKAKDFSISPNKKIKTVQAEFKENFGLCLRVYKGNQIADSTLTFAALNSKVSNKIIANNEDLVIKSSMSIGDFENLIQKHYGLKVQVANEFNNYLIENKYTLGQASRKEDLYDWCKKKGYRSIEDWLKKENCKTIEEYYIKNKSL